MLVCRQDIEIDLGTQTRISFDSDFQQKCSNVSISVCKSQQTLVITSYFVILGMFHDTDGTTSETELQYRGKN